MPYIKQTRRNDLDLRKDQPRTVGELNYQVTQLVRGYLHVLYGLEPGYAAYNEVIGVLECAKLELYRRAVAPYEDVKIQENGDVYGS